MYDSGVEHAGKANTYSFVYNCEKMCCLLVNLKSIIDSITSSTTKKYVNLVSLHLPESGLYLKLYAFHEHITYYRSNQYHGAYDITSLNNNNIKFVVKLNGILHGFIFRRGLNQKLIMLSFRRSIKILLWIFCFPCAMFSVHLSYDASFTSS